MWRLAVAGLAASVVTPRSARADDGAFVSVGAGVMLLSRTRDQSTNDILGGSVELGQSLHPNVRLVESIEGTSGVIDSSSPIVRESHLLIALGLRWIPFVPAPASTLSFDATSIYVDARVGIDVRERSPYGAPDLPSATSLGPTGAAMVGYAPVQGADYQIGVELAEHLSHYADGYQHGLSILVVGQLRR